MYINDKNITIILIHKNMSYRLMFVLAFSIVNSIEHFIVDACTMTKIVENFNFNEENINGNDYYRLLNGIITIAHCACVAIVILLFFWTVN